MAVYGEKGGLGEQDKVAAAMAEFHEGRVHWWPGSEGDDLAVEIECIILESVRKRTH
jgi:hypothetical protein